MSLFDSLVKYGMPLVPKSIVGRVAQRYVAGEGLDDAVQTLRTMNEEGSMGTVDVLGEEVQEPSKASEAVAEYLKLLDRIQTEKLDANISIKPTMLGLKIDQELCEENVALIVNRAAELENFVRIDMEDHTCTDATLRIYQDLQPKYGNLGVVFQSYMRRTLQDIEEMPESGSNIRLCKGIYIEPRKVAWKGYETVRYNFVAALEKMIHRDIYAAVATHDEYLVCAAVALLERHQVPHDRYEFQMLLGVDEELRQILIDAGHRLRVYVPYGKDWYPYSTRRLRENPEMAIHVMRAMLGVRKQ